MNQLNEIIGFGIILTGISTVAIICLCIFQIMTGDEQDTKIYLKRIKHAFIAFILVISIFSIQKMITKDYFNENELNIGQAPDNIDTELIAGLKDKDIADRDTFVIDGESYVITDKNKTLKTTGSWFSNDKIANVGYAKKLSECQGFLKGYGSSANTYYLVFFEETGNYVITAYSDVFSVNQLSAKVLDEDYYNYLYQNKTKVNILKGTYNY